MESLHIWNVNNMTNGPWKAEREMRDGAGWKKGSIKYISLQSSPNVPTDAILEDNIH
jgi:hypothetical protein